MRKSLSSRFFSALMSVGLLLSNIPLAAVTYEKEYVAEKADKKLVYLGIEASNFAPIIEKISALDDDKESLVHALRSYIADGFIVAGYDEIMETLAYAEMVLERTIHRASRDAEKNQLYTDFLNLVEQVMNGSLSIDSTILDDANRSCHQNACVNNTCVFVIDKNLQVCGKSLFKEHMRTKEGIHVGGHLVVDKSAKFKDDVTFKDDVKFEDEVTFEDDVLFEGNVTIEGTLSAADAIIGSLSVSDLVVTSCMDSLCVNNLSVNDLVVASCIDSLCVNNLSVNDLVVASCMDSLCVNDLSVVDLSVSGTASINDAFIVNATIDNLDIIASVLDSIIANLTVTNVASINDAIITDLTVVNCVNTLCVDNLSVVDASIINLSLSGDVSLVDLSVVDVTVTGTLSVNDLVVNNCMTSLCVDSLSVTDLSVSGTLSVTNEVIQNLSVTDLTVVSCIDSLCVNSLSATDLSISGTLSVTNEVIQNLSVTDLTVVSCMDSLCVNSLSVVDESVSGTLTVTNEIVTNETVTTLSSTDVVIQNLTVNNCIANLCVTNLSVVDLSVSSVLSTADEVINGDLQITSLTPAGVLHNDSSGNITTSLIVNADVDAAAAIVDTKLATISTAGKVANSATTATSSNTPNTIVLRDGSGNFMTNEITITGTVTNPTDAATKAYVDAAVSGGLVAHDPAVVVSTVNQTLSGLPTIDGVALNAGDRVLLTGQTNPVENGLWQAQVGAWNRPADFASGTPAGQAYVLITSGTVYGGSSWLCNTPTAIIDTDPIFFALFSLPNATTGANVGAGTGLVFRDKTGNTLNFRTLIAGTDIVITNNANDITIATDGTPANTANTLVRRSASGGFSAGAVSATDAVISNTLTVTPFNTAGVVHNNASGLFSSSLIVNADVAAGAGIVDTKLATISTAGKVANSATTATSANTANAIVARDGAGSFSATTVTLSGNVAFTGATSTSTTGNITKAGTVFLHNFGTNNTFLGANSGNFTLTGTQNTGEGTSTLAALTSGSNNTAVGSLALTAVSSGAQNVAVGTGALQANTTGLNNIAVGFQAMNANTTGVNNVGIGNQALLVNTIGSSNVAIGANALDANTTGTDNVAIGINALTNCATGVGNTAVGSGSLQTNTIGIQNTAVGYQTILSNTTGGANTACGFTALRANTTGGANVAIGHQAMLVNTTGNNNTAVGTHALQNNVTGSVNTAVGFNTLGVSTGDQNTGLGNNVLEVFTSGAGNTALGRFAGQNLTSGSQNIYINHLGVASESNTIRLGDSGSINRCFIAGVRGITTGVNNAINVLVDGNGQFGTVSSTIRVKHDVEDMGDASSDILNVRPVTFIYNGDETETRQYGLIAEEVEEIFPAIVVKDAEGQPETIQYHVLPVLLLNEVKKQQATIARQDDAIANLVITVENMQAAIDNLQSQMQRFVGKTPRGIAA